MSFYVIYPDGRKFGPATPEILGKWVQEGRITPLDWVEDESGAKLQAFQVPGVSPIVASEPPLPTSAPQPPPPWQGGAPAQPAGKRSLAGVIVVIVFLVIAGFAVLLRLSVSSVGNAFDQASTAPFRSISESNAKQLGAAVLAYANDHQGRFPPDMRSAHAAMPQLARYVGSADVCRSGNPVGAEFWGNRGLGGTMVSGVANPRTTPMFYESRPWEDDTRFVVYVDGHTEQKPFDPATVLLGARAKQ